MKKLKSELAAVVAVAVLSLGPSAGAQASTYCVPTLSACPSGTGVAVADLEEAMSLNGKDGVADTVYVGAGTFSEDNDYEPGPGFSSPETFEVGGNDPLTVIGAGAGATAMTSAGTKNIYLANLSYNNGRKVLLRDLTIEVPSTLPDGLGSGILLYEGDTLEDAAVVSFNDDSDGVRTMGAGNVIRRALLRGGGLEGQIQDGITADAGSATAEDVEMEGASWGLATANNAAVLTARRITEVGTRTYGAIASGGTIKVENSIFELDDGLGLYVGSTTTDALLEADHLTVVNNGSNYPALEGKKFNTDAGDATMVVSNSIFRGFSSGYRTETPFGPGIGLVKLTARYSNLPSNGLNAGGTADFSTGNIDADPLFNADLSLPPNSPSVDAGDPGAGLPADFLGAARPNDGNGDGIAVRDQGAFEYQRPAPPGGGSGGGGAGQAPDTISPQTTIAKGPGTKLARGKAKFSFRSNEKGSRFQCKLDRRKVRPCRSPQRYTGLKPGRHVFKVWAIDAAGNKDPTPAKRRFRVPSSEFSAR